MYLNFFEVDSFAHFPHSARAFHTFMGNVLKFRVPFVCYILPLPTSPSILIFLFVILLTVLCKHLGEFMYITWCTSKPLNLRAKQVVVNDEIKQITFRWRLGKIMENEGFVNLWQFDELGSVERWKNGRKSFQQVTQWIYAFHDYC